MKFTNATLATIAIAISLVGPSAAQEASKPAPSRPKFLTETYPPHALEGLLQMYGRLKSKQSALNAKTLELIGLAVAAQIPCQYCVYAHTKQARLAGATNEEIREAVAMAGATRNFATVFNGMAYDFQVFKREHDQLTPPPAE